MRTGDSSDIKTTMFYTFTDRVGRGDESKYQYDISYISGATTFGGQYEGRWEPGVLDEPIHDSDDGQMKPNPVSEEELLEDYRIAIESITEYGGFYISRYQCSRVGSTANSVMNTGNAQSKANIMVPSYNDYGLGQYQEWIDAYNLAKSYPLTAKENGYFATGLCWGFNISALKCFLANSYAPNQPSLKIKPNVGEFCQGNQSLVTGSDETDCAYNIYDLVGCRKLGTHDELGPVRATVL